MRFNGKNVRLAFHYDRNLKLPALEPRELIVLNIVAREHKDSKAIPLLYFHKNDKFKEFFALAREIIREFIYSVISRHNDMLLGEDTTLHVFFDNEQGAPFSAMPHWTGTNESSINFHFNFSLIRGLINGEILPALYHEMAHNLNHVRIERETRITSKLDSSISGSVFLPKNLAFILKVFVAVRTEAFAVFVEFSKVNFAEVFRNAFFEDFISVLEDLSSDFKIDFKDEGFEAKITKEARCQELGGMMVTIIFLGRLMSGGMNFNAWFRTYGIPFFKTKERNAIELKDFFPRKSVVLFFSGDEIQEPARKMILELEKMDHLAFFSAYEGACKVIGIKNPVLHADSYHYYSTLCLYNFRKEKLHIDDEKLLRSLQRFRRYGL